MLNSKTQINKRSAGARKVLPKPLVDSFAPSRPWNLSHLDVPTFLMCPPISYSTKVPNNIWMEDLTESKRKVEPKKAYRQFQTLYQFLSSRGVVQLLPVPPDCALQDLVFTANLGILLEHLPAKDTVVLANYQSTPRVGETEVGVKFFQSMGYKTIVPKTKFEGEAELKHLYDNVYVGGYGIRSEKETYDQLENQFGMKIIKVRERDSYLYHLDCSIFPLTYEKTIVCTQLLDSNEIKELEGHTEIIDVSREEAIPGLCNSVRLGNFLLNGSHIHELKRGTEAYRLELAKNRRLEDIAADNGFELALFNLSEYQKGGAALSCMVMHLNRVSYQHRLL